MSILSLASAQTVYRGYEYFKGGNVAGMERSSGNTYTGVVAGSNGKRYDVIIDLDHPRKSQCACPHAAGKRIICKHMVALYFAAFPEEAAKYIAELEAYWEEEERQQEQTERRLIAKVESMRKSELQQALLTLLMDGPEWQYNHFIDEYL